MAGTRLVEISGVSKDYATADGPVPALERVSLDIGDGEFLSIVGPSGCGKSTLMLITAGLVGPSAGIVRVGGAAVEKPGGRVGIVFQDATLYEWRRALDNVLLPVDLQRLGRQRYTARARELMTLVGRPASSASIRSSCPVGCASAWPCAGRSCTTRRCS